MESNFIVTWRRGFKLPLLALLSILSLWSLIEAIRFDEAPGFGQPLDYYATGGVRDESSISAINELLRIGSPLEEAASGYLVDEQPLQDRLAYLIDDNGYRRSAGPQSRAAPYAQINDFMIDKIKQGYEDNGEVMNTDLNNSAEGDQVDDEFISAPVNNPVEFRTKTGSFGGQETALNSANRSSILDKLAIYLGDVMHNDLDQGQAKAFESTKKEKSDEEKESSDKNANNNNEQSVTEPADNELYGNTGSTSAASNYGNTEYIDHPLAIVGHQYVQGGAGEGRQLLGPDGTFENVQVIKTDRAAHSYCNPPNPCPIGYTAEDGCLEDFINSASFSREYQAKQQCSCDNEHSLFNCASPVSTMKSQLTPGVEQSTEQDLDHGTKNTMGDDNDDDQDEHNDSKLDTLARTIQNRFGDLDSVRHLISVSKQQSSEKDPNGEVLIYRVAKKAPRVESDYRY